jgi:putative membrane protein
MAPSAYALLAAHPLVHVNASLNGLATALLLVGLYLVKRGRIEAHKRTMLAAFGVSAAFLACYLWYHAHAGHVVFTQTGFPRFVYLTILWTHIPLAFTVPFLAVSQIYLGYRALGCCGTEPSAAVNYRIRHIRLARWTFPIWLYVSVTGVAVYVMLYHLWPPAGHLWPPPGQ